MINPEMVGQAQIATFALAQQVAQSASDWSFTKFFGHNPHPPTTGMLAIFAALSACDQVNAFSLTVNLSAPAKASRRGCAKYYVGRPHSGRLCMTPTEYFGKEGARACILNRVDCSAASMRHSRLRLSSFVFPPCAGVYCTRDWSMQTRAFQRLRLRELELVRII